MNGKKSKLIRRVVYGKDMSIRGRKYTETNIRRYKTPVKDEAQKKSLASKGYQIIKEKAQSAKESIMNAIKEMFIWKTSTLVSDEKRRKYRWYKKRYTRTPWNRRHELREETAA